MSIQIKKFRTKTKDLIYDGVESKNTEDSVVTKEEFNHFVNTGEVPEQLLSKIAKKIIDGKQMSREELSVYAEHGKMIEDILYYNKVEIIS